jgi:hypothetical protein
MERGEEIMRSGIEEGRVLEGAGVVGMGVRG